MECGSPLASACPNCSALNPAAAKFCGECAAPLQSDRERVPAGGASPAPALPAPAGVAERRLVTVLFADLVGFTGMAADQDPEDTREFLTRYFDLTRTVIERYGGTVEKFIGDAVMAVWGAPTAHEDDAERAVRAALEIVNGVPALDDKLAVQVRAGLLTGEAAVTLGATGQGMVAGDLVNTASRLQSVAPPGSVLVGESTFHAASGVIGFEEAGDQVLKGKQAPVPAWRATAVVGLRRGHARSTLEPPFTGRDEELRLLKELFHATEREGRARLAAVVGEGGIGKSRLAWEFEKYIDGVVGSVWWHYGRSPAYGEGISYWALAEMVRGRAGIAETDEPSVARARLRGTVEEWLVDEQERRWIEPRLAALLALEPMPPGSRDELFAAWRTFFERIAERGPTVLVFEDLQWADDGMLDFVVELLDRLRNRPILVITLARPELTARRPGWSASLRNLTQMSLEPLAPEQMAEMVRGTVPGITTEATQTIVERAAGIPLYAVETIRMLIDRGDLVAASDGRYEMRGPIEHVAVPATLQALIAARLDALGEADRRLIQTAAVVGQSFTAEVLAAVVGQTADALRERLAGLVGRQLLTVDVDPRSPERGQYQFVQAVVKEVAEGSLSRADRRALHVAAARFYESLGDDELAGVLASHYVEAYRAAQPGPEADALAAQARVSLRGAADRAISLHSNKQALAYLEQALAVTTEDEEIAALHERAVEPALNEGLYDAALEHARAVESLSRDRGDRLAALHAVTLQARVHLSHHHERTAITQLEPALNGVRDMAPTSEIVAAQAELARALMIGGSAAESIAWCDRALAASALADDRLLTDILITKGTALTNVGRQIEGEILLRGSMQVADRTGDTWVALRARNNVLGVVSAEDLAAAAALAAEGYTTAMRHGLLTWAYQFAHVSLSLAFERGDWDAWVEEADALDAPGFFGAWRVLEEGVRDALRGRTAEARRKLAEGGESAGTESTQAETGIAGIEALFAFAQQDWEAVMPAARRAWVITEGADSAIVVAAATAAAANRTDWAREAMAVFDGLDRRGRQAAGTGAGLRATLAMLEGRWPDARREYLEARRNLAESESRYALALLNLSIGGRGPGHLPEATEATAAAREFFDRVGADRLVDAYLAALVPVPASGVAAQRANRPSDVPAS
jgi:class 3 adenylate cyclase/tetratricopeptide (TPR) repeat protein